MLKIETYVINVKYFLFITEDQDFNGHYEVAVITSMIVIISTGIIVITVPDVVTLVATVVIVNASYRLCRCCCR